MDQYQASQYPREGSSEIDPEVAGVHTPLNRSSESSSGNASRGRSTMPTAEDIQQDLSQYTSSGHPTDDLLSNSGIEGSAVDGEITSSGYESTDYDDDGDSDSSFEETSTNTPLNHDKHSWDYTFQRREGRVIIVGEWRRGTQYHRDLVIGPDWPCTIVTYIVILIFAICVIAYLADNIYELVVYCAIVAITMYSLTVVFLADPGLLRKYHHARKSNWTYCDHCSSFRMPGTVHCSTCQVCIAGYDHHCPWTGKCIGRGTLIHFKIFAFGMTLVVLGAIILGILSLTLPNRLTHALV